MLQQILDSKHSPQILSFLLVAPKRAFSPKELRRRIGVSNKSLNKALRLLLDFSMIKSFAKGKQRYYLLNERHKLLPEIKQSLSRSKKIYQDELFKAVGRLGHVRASFLSGLFTGHPELPVDILLVGKINLKRLSKFLESCKKMMGHDVNYSVMTEGEFKLRRDTFDRFIKDIFDYPHVVVIDKLTQSKKKY